MILIGTQGLYEITLKIAITLEKALAIARIYELAQKQLQR